MWKRIANRSSLVLSLSSIGLLVCGAVVEIAGYLMPFEGWATCFLFYGVAFGFAYWWTCPVNPPAETPDTSSDSP